MVSVGNPTCEPQVPVEHGSSMPPVKATKLSN